MKNKIVYYFVGIIALFFILLNIILLYIYSNTNNKIYNVSNVPETDIAIVFGAQVKPDGTPSDALKSRLDAAIDLYKDKKISKLLFTGDNSIANYDEVTNMKKYAVSKDIPENIIKLDYAGFRTLDSCYRAKKIFGINKAILISQHYHLYRAIYICQQAGIESVAIAASDYPGLSLIKGKIREIFAIVQAFIEINVTHTQPKFLGQFEGI